MIRRISLILLLVNTSVIMAQPLYKWVEADGSITFSPKRPSADTSYTTVESAATAKPQLAAARKTPNTQHTPEPATAIPRVVYTPVGAVSQSGAGLLAPKRSPQTESTIPTVDTPSEEQLHVSSAAANKLRRCQDLRKRVVSLERRMKFRLTPEDMDNTVIHMARYQRSFDQHCVQ